MGLAGTTIVLPWGGTFVDQLTQGAVVAARRTCTSHPYLPSTPTVNVAASACRGEHQHRDRHRDQPGPSPSQSRRRSQHVAHGIAAPVYLRSLGQVALTGVEDDGLVVDKVADCDRVRDVVGQGAVAAVGDRPVGASDGRRGVFTAGAELALGAGVEQLQGLARERGGGGVRGLVLLARGVGRRALERASTIDSVASPLWAWLILKIAPPNVPDWVLGLPLPFLPLPFLPFAAASVAACPPVAVMIRRVPPSASISVFLGNCSNWVRGTNRPVLVLISTTPLTGARLNVRPRVGKPGAGADWVLNVTSVPTDWPFLFVATRRTW